MTTEQRLDAILSAVQHDPGNRGLARIPQDNLFTRTAGDFASACRSLADTPTLSVRICTGFFIPTGNPPAFETDGPLGALLLYRAILELGGHAEIHAEEPILRAMTAVCHSVNNQKPQAFMHEVFIERAGPARDGNCYTMRGHDITPHLDLRHSTWTANAIPSIGIGDGGNEVGMGKIPPSTIAANIANGAAIHCIVPADHLIVAGVSNWGAYALAAGLFILRGVMPSATLFDADAELEQLKRMVQAGPLVDGVTGQPTATVDGLSWDEYSKTLKQIQEILA